MSDATASSQTFASGRYSKRKRTQVTYHLDDLDYSDTESDFESPRAKKPKAKTTSRPLPKRKIFPFLDLPAEIRNTIYNYTLSDPSGINLVGAFRNRRRTVVRMPAKDANPSSMQMPVQSYLDGTAAARGKAPPTLVPSLLAVNKQIYAEGINILYGHEFVFHDASTLYSFLINLGPSGARHIKSIRLKRWEYSRGKGSYNHVCFAVLAWATNLTSFHIDAPVGNYRSTNEGGDQFYRNAFVWLEAFGAAKGKRDAALDILHLGKNCFPNHWSAYRSTSQSDSHAEKVKKFKAAVADCLNKRHDSVMGISDKSVKKAKKTAETDEW